MAEKKKVKNPRNKPKGSKVKGKETKPATKAKALSKKRKSKPGPKKSAVKVKKPTRKGEVHKRGMSERAWKFCHEYVRIGIRYLAAISAGYAKASAHTTANRLLKDEKILNKIAELQNKYRKKMDVSIEMVVAEYAKIGFTDITDVADMSTGRPIFKEVEAIDPRHLSAIQALGTDSKGRIKIKMHSKPGALDSLSKKLGIFKDEKLIVEHTIGKVTKKDVKLVKSIFDDITEE